MSIRAKYFVVLDPATHTLRIDYGFILGVFAGCEDALRAAKAQGWKLPEPGVSGHPEPPTESAETAG
jgi:hypothetical protein